MAERYEHLIQAIGTNIDTTIFTSENNSITIIKDIFICNTSDIARQFSLALVKNNEVISNKSYIFNKTKIDAHETITITSMLTINPNTQIKLWSDLADSISVNAFGIIVNL